MLSQKKSDKTLAMKKSYKSYGTGGAGSITWDWTNLRLLNSRSPQVQHPIELFCRMAYMQYLSTFIEIVAALRVSTFTNFHHSIRGQTSRRWVHSDLGFIVLAFAIQPETDLVVLLEGHASNGLDPSACPQRHLRIHSRTMTIDAPHPLAAASPSLLDVGNLSSFCIENSNPPELYGRTLIIQLKCTDTNSELESIIVLSDWITGVQLGRIELNSDPGPSIRFLSDEYFVIPQEYQDLRTPSAEHIPQSGKLLIFYLPPPAEGPENRQVRQVVTSLFPRISTTEDRLHLYFNHGAPPVPKGSYWSAQSRIEPKTYDFNRWKHLCLYYESFDLLRVLPGRVRPQWRFGKDLEPIGLLYISSHGLLALLHSYAGTKQSHDLPAIPWEAWKAYAVSLPAGDTHGG